MPLIKLANGAIVFSANSSTNEHYIENSPYIGKTDTIRPSLTQTRGSLANIKYGSDSKVLSPEDKIWEKEVIASMMTIGECFKNFDYLSPEQEEILWVFGIYEKDPEPRFNEKYFIPSDH